MSDLSPLFALEAEQLLLDNKIEDAIFLCNSGIEEYPNYTAAYAVLAQAYIQQNNIDASLKAIKNGLSYFPEDIKLQTISKKLQESGDNSTLYKKPNKINLDNLENKIPDTPDEKIDEDNINALFDESQDKVEISDLPNVKNIEVSEKNIELQTDIIQDYDFDISEDSNTKREDLLATNLNLIPGLENNPLLIRKEHKEQHYIVDLLPDFPPFDIEYPLHNDKDINMLRNLAIQLEEASIKPLRSTIKTEDPYQVDSDVKIVASETMANIYTQQRAFPQAIKIYEVLAEKESDSGKKEFFNKKIKELKENL